MRTLNIDASGTKLAEVQEFIMEMRRELHSGGLGFPYGIKGMLDWVTAFSDSRNDRVSKVYQYILDLTEDHKFEYKSLGGWLASHDTPTKTIYLEKDWKDVPPRMLAVHESTEILTEQLGALPAEAHVLALVFEKEALKDVGRDWHYWYTLRMALEELLR